MTELQRTPVAGEVWAFSALARHGRGQVVIADVVDSPTELIGVVEYRYRTKPDADPVAKPLDAFVRDYHFVADDLAQAPPLRRPAPYRDEIRLGTEVR